MKKLLAMVVVFVVVFISSAVYAGPGSPMIDVTTKQKGDKIVIKGLVYGYGPLFVKVYVDSTCVYTKAITDVTKRKRHRMQVKTALDNATKIVISNSKGVVIVREWQIKSFSRIVTK